MLEGILAICTLFAIAVALCIVLFPVSRLVLLILDFPVKRYTKKFKAFIYGIYVACMHKLGKKCTADYIAEYEERIAILRSSKQHLEQRLNSLGAGIVRFKVEKLFSQADIETSHIDLLAYTKDQLTRELMEQVEQYVDFTITDASPVSEPFTLKKITACINIACHVNH